MELVEQIPAASRVLVGREVDFEVAAGQHLALGRFNPVVTFLNETVPAGKKWVVNCSIRIVEIDV